MYLWKVSPPLCRSVVSGAIFIRVLNCTVKVLVSSFFFFFSFFFLPPNSDFFQMTSIPLQLPILLDGYSTADSASWSAKRWSAARKTSLFSSTNPPCLHLPIRVHTHAEPCLWGVSPSLAPLRPSTANSFCSRMPFIHQYPSALIFKGSFSVLSVNN